MKTKVLNKDFFNRAAMEVAEDLLGKFLVRKYRGKEIAGMITEVEIYEGFKDKASHAYKGVTGRNKPMFGEAGNWYVYLVYGIHYMLNIVCGKKDYPSAILIRGVEGVSGPGKLTKHFKIDKSFNHKPATKETGLWIKDRGVKIKLKDIRRSNRIGVDYAGKYWAGRLYNLSIR